MPQIKTDDGTHIYYDDWGQGPTVVLIHGWPLSADMWQDNATYLAENGCRVVMYDRRGFGRSSKPWNGYDYDTFAADLKAVIDQLNLSDVVLCGFSMGGGEVARYIGRYGTAKVRGAALVSAVTPYLSKTDDNPDGVPPSTFDPIMEGLQKDRAHFFAGFEKDFFGYHTLEKKTSEEQLQWAFNIAMLASQRATVESAKAFAMTDFRNDLKRFDKPTLIIHGTGDKTVPIDNSARPAHKLISGSQLVEYEGEPHALNVTAKDRFNADLLKFVRG
ncbi:MAG: alpha/beta hydrolase [Caulobacteraceae bacterium]|nr:alpha/beta hydrolase [Caulobacter sp.]